MPLEAAHALALGQSTIYIPMASGDIVRVRIGASRLILAEALRRCVQRLSAGTDDATSCTVGARRTNQQPAIGVTPWSKGTSDVPVQDVVHRCPEPAEEVRPGEWHQKRHPNESSEPSGGLLRHKLPAQRWWA